jgi:DnaJ-class molecular chaperone
MSGFLKEDKVLRIKIPVASKNGDVLRVKNMGNQTLNDEFGSLMIHLNIKDVDGKYTF